MPCECDKSPICGDCYENHLTECMACYAVHDEGERADALASGD